MGTETDNLGLYKPLSGEDDWANSMNSNLDILDAISQNFQSNMILNGDFQVAQLGTEFTTTLADQLTVDRWRAKYAGMDVEKTVLDDGASGLRIARNTATGTFQHISQKIEVPSYMVGCKMTLSGKIQFNESSPAAYAYLNWKSGPSPLTISWSSMGVDRTNTTDVQEFKKTITIPEYTDSDYLHFHILGNGSDGTVNYDFSIGDLKLEPGSVATPFCPRPYALEELMCLRYLQIYGGVGQGYIAPLVVLSSTAAQGGMIFPKMCVAPTATYEGCFALRGSFGSVQVSAMSIIVADEKSLKFANAIIDSESLTPGEAVYLRSEEIGGSDHGILKLDTGY